MLQLPGALRFLVAMATKAQPLREYKVTVVGRGSATLSRAIC